MTTVRRACQWCEAICGLEIEVEDNRILSVVGDETDPLSQGFLCPKGAATVEVAADPDRLRTPVRRQPDGTFTEIGWDEAFDLAGDLLRKLRVEHGNDSIATYIGNPAGTATAAFHIGMLIDAIGTRNQFSAASTDQSPQSLVSWLLFGNQFIFPVPDLDRTDHLFILGANPIVSNGSLVSAPDWRRRIRGIKDRGGKVVVVDPRRTETARTAGNHVAVRPGADALLVAAMIQVIDEERLVRLGRAATFTDEVDVLLDAVREVTPERVAATVGITAEEIRTLAIEFATAPSAAAYSRIGPCHTRDGSVVAWLVIALNVVTGNLDRVGGAMFTRPPFDLQKMVALTGRGGSYDTHRSRVAGHPEVNGEYPIATLADEIETPGEGQVRGLLLIGGNITRSAPNGDRLTRGIEQLDVVIAVDPYINETTRHADVILPPIAPYEREHFDYVFTTWAVRNHARLSPPAIAPHPDSRTEHDILNQLARRIGVTVKERASLRLATAAMSDPMRTFDLGIKAGPWGLRRGRTGLSIKKLRAAGGTIDLGPLTPEMPGRLFTDDQRLHLSPKLLVDALAAAVEELLAAASNDADQLQLLGRRQLRSKNTWMHNSPMLVKGRDRCTLLIHPNDAKERGIEDGDTVTVTSRVGEVRVPAEVTEDLAIGVVSIPHGWGHDADEMQASVARANPGASVNTLTDDRLLERLTGNAAFSDLRVTVARSG